MPPLRTTLCTAAVVVTLAAPGLGRAADQTVHGQLFVVQGSIRPNKQTILSTAKEGRSPNTLVGDPTTSGATLTVTANGANPTTQTFVLPAGTGVRGRPFWIGDAARGLFKYRDPKALNGPVKLVILKLRNATFFVKVLASGGRNTTIAVVPPNPGTSACVLLAINGGDSYSVKFGSDSRLVNRGARLFKAIHPPTQGTCVTTTTSTTIIIIPTTTSTTLYGSPSRAFIGKVPGLLD